ncbi:acyltransferase ChoActase/COT/CPT, partial [Cokeromyces recurvatus]|uniref:acyltransferase ChoActase/COT/CPT n=1 Tax=Cokeromyces recurvatus TaxID=90255 RepID=UPI00221ED645
MSLPTFSLQHTLPKLPVPSLEETCSLYLKSVKPLQSTEEHEKTRTIVAEFLASDLSKSLQQRLIDIDHVSPTNWLEDNFWLKKAYLEWRDPLMVNSNWYILGQSDPRQPKELTSTITKGQFSNFQIKRAAHLIHRGLQYKEFIDKQELPIEMIMKDKKSPLCMWQYSRIFSVTRIPAYHCDTLVQTDSAKVYHILVLLRDQIYKLDVYKQIQNQWVLLTVDEIEKALLDLVIHVQHHLKTPSPPIGLLTSWQRDNWAIARNHLLMIDPSLHRTHLTIIEQALFAVALDDHSNGTDGASWTKTILCGHQGLGHGHNRWYDKSFTLVVENNGMCGLSGEHSPVDALTVSYIFDYMLKEPLPPSQPIDSNFIINKTSTALTLVTSFEHLSFMSSPILDSYLESAQRSANEIAALSDSNVLIFKEFGTDWIKRVGKLSPDAFLQMSLQLAYYRIHHKVTPTYETAATRKYLRGRTETIRTVSLESKAFVEGFDQPHLDSYQKYTLLKEATIYHRTFTQIASDGHGCDRHLFVLRLLNEDHQVLDNQGELVSVPMHPLFKDPIFTESQTWRLSTSGLHAGIRLMGTGFGAIYRDGYGINYMAAPNLVKFGIESKRVKETASTEQFMEAITKALIDIRQVCEQVNKTVDGKL